MYNYVRMTLQDALRTYLLRKLDHLGKEDRAQITMISTWASELYLDKVVHQFIRYVANFLVSFS